MRMRLLPHPLLSLVLALVWVLLVNDFSFAQSCLRTDPRCRDRRRSTAVYWPGRPKIRNPLAIVEYALVVLWDIVVSNVQVAYLVLFRRGDSLQSHVHHDAARSEPAEAIATLAGTITMTPGTVSADLSADGRSLLVHCLDTDDPDGTVRQSNPGTKAA